MKNLSLLFISFLLLQFTSLAQEGWFWQNPLPQGNNLNDIHIIDENNIVVFGNNTVVKTSDGGVNWDVIDSDISIQSVHFIDDFTGYAGGLTSTDEGVILKTTDGGVSWVTKKYETYAVNEVHFIDNNIGWAVSGLFATDGKIIKTTDGGESWTTQYTNPDYGLTSLVFTDANIGWAVGHYGTILKTSNGGDLWVQQNSGIYTSLLSVYFNNNDTGWTVGYPGMVLKTTNGGTNWFEQTGFGAGWLQSVVFIDNNIGWVVGRGLDIIEDIGGYIMKTTDGGTSWNMQFATTPSGFNSILPINENLVWTVGTEGTILKTSDGGSIWNEVSSGTRNFLFSVQFIDENTGWAVGKIADGAGGYIVTPERHDSTIILKTTDGGDEWFSQYSSITEFFKSAYFTDLNTGWLVGSKTNYYGGIIYKTTNGGDDWIDQSIGGLSNPYYNSVHFINNSIGWVVGFDGLVLKTTNGGEDWLSYSTGTEHELTSIFFTDSLNGWAVGNIYSDDDYRIFNSIDGGETWSTQFNSIYFLNDLFFVDSNNGWVVGYYTDYSNQVGVVLKTTNGGIDWTVQEINSTTQFTSVYFSDMNNGWANGTELIRTTNCGDDWLIANSPVYGWGNNSIFFIDDHTGWIVGIGGAILKTTTGGVSFIEEEDIDEMPTEYNLSQNYPNPFNPSTKIQYSVSQSSNVVIKIFDILGNEIETLVNEEKQAGTYEITWYAENLPSGVYFYRLQAGSFVDTKKMVLMK